MLLSRIHYDCCCKIKLILYLELKKFIFATSLWLLVGNTVLSMNVFVMIFRRRRRQERKSQQTLWPWKKLSRRNWPTRSSKNEPGILASVSSQTLWIYNVLFIKLFDSTSDLKHSSFLWTRASSSKNVFCQKNTFLLQMQYWNILCRLCTVIAARSEPKNNMCNKR